MVCLLDAGTVTADTDPVPLPAPCLGYDARINRFKLDQVTFQVTELTCSPGYGFLFHLPVVGRDRGRNEVAPSGTCCPLYPGALLDEHRYRPVVCGDGEVITGGRMVNPPAPGTADPRPVYEVRCTRIDTTRFALGPAGPGMVIEYGQDPWYGIPFGAALSARDADDPARTTWGMVPLRLRYGVGRVSATSWQSSGCIGYPWGSVLTGLGSRGCRGFQFRELVPVAADGTPLTREEDRTGAPIPGRGGLRTLTIPAPPKIDPKEDVPPSAASAGSAAP